MMEALCQVQRRENRRANTAFYAALCFVASGCSLLQGSGGVSPLPSVTSGSMSVSSVAVTSGLTATLIHVRGTVRYRLGGSQDWSDVATSVALPPASDVRTLAASVAELRFPDGSVSRLAPETALRVQAYPQQSDTTLTDLRLYGGEVWQSVIRLDGKPSDTRIATPHLIALVRGTGYDVASGSDGGRVAVAVGRVEVRTLKSKETLAANQGVTVSATSAKTFDATDLLREAWAINNLFIDVYQLNTLATAAGAAPPTSPEAVAMRTVGEFYTTIPVERVRAIAQGVQDHVGYAYMVEPPTLDAAFVDTPTGFGVSETFVPPTDVPGAPPDVVGGAIDLGGGAATTNPPRASDSGGAPASSSPEGALKLLGVEPKK